MTETAIRPLILDEYPVDYDYGSMNLYVREGEETALLAITDKPRGYDEDELPEDGRDDEEAKTHAIDMHLDSDELFALAMACGKALATISDPSGRANLIELIKGLTDELGEMR